MAGTGEPGRRAIALLCGLPASGKTTVARNLEERCSGFELRVVTFDSVLEETLEGRPWTPRDWHAARRKMVQVCTELASSLSAQDRVILVEDNFDLQSLRREFYRVSRSCNAGYIAIEVMCSLEECLCRNERRSGVVLDDVIRRMYSRFEHVGVEPWERAHSAQICTEGCSAADAANEISRLIDSSWSAALKLIPSTAAIANPAEEQTPIHTVDLQLRRLVQNTVTQGESA